jgi:glycerol-3-phosphate dehydrogenase
VGHVTDTYDVAVVGAGVVGCAIAMELSRYGLAVVLLEADCDIGSGTSKGNSAILHTGFDAPPGSIEAALVRRGYERYHELSESLGLPIGHTGAIVIAWTEEQAALLPAIASKAQKNCVHDIISLTRDEVYAAEPHLGRGVVAGLRIPGESITCPFTPVIAFATTALQNGVTLKRRFKVQSVERRDGHFVLSSEGATVRSTAAINAAGLYSDEIDSLFGKQEFHIRPRKGEFLVYDKPARTLISNIILPVPTERTKGVLIAPTVFGNVLLGPTAVDVEDKRDTSVSSAAICQLLEAGSKILPALERETVTCTYAGLRAATAHQDYQLHFYPDERYVTAGGIRSTGLSASLGIAEHIAQTVATGFGHSGTSRGDWNPHRAPPITELSLRTAINPELISKDGAYGNILCHCESVSVGEIRDALNSAIPPEDLGGIKRRTRALMGRCQGFNCYARISAMLDAHGSH